LHAARSALLAVRVGDDSAPAESLWPAIRARLVKPADAPRERHRLIRVAARAAKLRWPAVAAIAALIAAALLMPGTSARRRPAGAAAQTASRDAGSMGRPEALSALRPQRAAKAQGDEPAHAATALRRNRRALPLAAAKNQPPAWPGQQRRQVRSVSAALPGLEPAMPELWLPLGLPADGPPEL